MKLGVSTPVVMQLPAVASGWEADGTAADLALVAAAADELGYDFLTCAEHVVVPTVDAPGRGDTYWDPVATLGFPAHSSRIRLATSVVVLGYPHPLIAKQYGTLDQLSGGRVVLGVGVGSLEAEFALLGASFADRGTRAEMRCGPCGPRWGGANPPTPVILRVFRLVGESVRTAGSVADVGRREDP